MTNPNDPFTTDQRPEERRKHPRLERHAPIELLNMGDDPAVPFYQDLVTGETLDVSEGGIRLRVAYDVREGSEVGVVIRKEQKFQVFLAKVIWKIRESIGITYGLRATKMDPSRLP